MEGERLKAKAGRLYLVAKIIVGENMDDIKLMVLLTQKTKDWMGNDAYKVPDGRCTTNLNYAVCLWKEFLNKI